MHPTTLLLLTLTSTTTSLPTTLHPRQISCSSVHLIVARASGEDPGEGIIGAVSSDIQSRVPNADAEAIDYPATLANYQSSEAEGVAEMTRVVTDYAAACPDSQLVLMGYSQGGQVAMDTICGTSSAGFAATEPLDAGVAAQIAAVVVMGEPTFVPGEAYTVGDASEGAVFPRVDTGSCLPLAERIQSYCSEGDTFCDSGNSILTHLGYVREFGDEAADFVVGRVGAGAAAAAAARG